MTKPTEIQGLLTQVRQAAEKLKSKIHELDNQIESLCKRRNTLAQGPLSKPDYMDIIRSDIQAKGRLFATNLKRHLEAGSQISYSAALQAGAGGLPIRYLDAGANIGAAMAEGAYYLYFEDAIVAGVDRALAGKEWPVDAIPAAEREKALQAVSGQIEALTMERDTLAGDLSSCGLKE